MIFDYLIGFTITIFTIVLFQLLGMCFTKPEKSYSYSFVVGFVIYSFFVAIIGIPIQILNLSWNVFFYAMIILLSASIGCIIYFIATKKLIITVKIVKEYFIQNWFLYVGAFILVMIALGHVEFMWENNQTDDGYYLNRMSSLPFVDNPFRTDPVTGFAESSISPYSLNTFELEGSFYIYITGLAGTLYARVFLALLNYFILLNIIQAFMYKLINYKTKIIEMNILQYIIVPVFIIFVMNSSNFVVLSETWTVSSAAYYGSALVRVGCPFICLMALIGERKLDFKKLLFTFMVCVVMVSKSTIAVPILFVLAIGYLLTLLDQKILKIALVLILIVIGFVLPDVAKVNSYTVDNIISSFLNVYFIVAVIILFLCSAKNKIYLHLITILGIAFITVMIPEVNDTYEVMSNYTFVADRFLYSIVLFVLIVAIVSVVVYLFDKIHLKKGILIVGVASTLLSVTIIEIKSIDGVSLSSAIKLYSKNTNIVPGNTITLGEKLEDYYKETKRIPVVLMSPGLEIDGYSHFDAALLRSFAPHSISLTGSVRTQKENLNKDSGFYGFSLNDLQIYFDFVVNPNENTAEQLRVLHEKYPFNTIVGVNFNDTHKYYLNTIGFKLYADVNEPNTIYTYSIFVNE